MLSLILASDFFRSEMSTKLSIRYVVSPALWVLTLLIMGIVFPFNVRRVRSEFKMNCPRSVIEHFPFSAGQTNLWHSSPTICSLVAPKRERAYEFASTILWVLALTTIIPERTELSIVSK